MDATSGFRHFPNNGIASLNLEDLRNKLNNAEALETEGNIKVYFREYRGSLPIEKVWKRVNDLAKDQKKWDRAQTDHFIAAVNRLEQIEDAGFYQLKGRIDPCIAFFCCWCHIPSSEASKMMRLAWDLQMKLWRSSGVEAQLVERSSDGSEKLLEETRQ